MLEMFTRTYIDTSEFPSKVKMDTLKEGEYIYEVRIVRERLYDKLQIVKRRVDDTFTFGELKRLGKTIFSTEEEARIIENVKFVLKSEKGRD